MYFEIVDSYKLHLKIIVQFKSNTTLINITITYQLNPEVIFYDNQVNCTVSPFKIFETVQNAQLMIYFIG